VADRDAPLMSPPPQGAAFGPPPPLLLDIGYRQRGPGLIRWLGLAALAAVLVGVALVASGRLRPADDAGVSVDIGEGSPARAAYLRLIKTQPLPKVEPVEARAIDPEAARAINAAVPFVKGPIAAARPYRAKLADADRARAADCLSAAMWYEAGMDWDGQRAVAQVVLNRLRHPAFPKTVCGVVFQGSERSTGCQFTFTCDGAMARTPPDWAWTRTRTAAEAALDGAVYPKVGLATHYHTNWVSPYWSSSLDKVAAVRTHLFFRWRGGWGTPIAFQASPSSSEPVIAAMARLSSAHAGSADANAVPTATDATLAALPAVAPGSGGPMNAAGIADPMTLAALPRLRAGQVTLVHPEGDAFVVRLSAGSPPGAQALDAIDLCASKRFCKVMGWVDADVIPRRFPIGSVSSDRIAFLYIRQNGQEFVRWDCAQIPNPPGGRCMGAASEQASLASR